MPDKQVVAWIREKYSSIVSELDERGRRRWAAIEARSLGWGGIAAVASATGISDRTIRNGIGELEGPDDLGDSRQRRPGAGRRSREEEQPEILDALDAGIGALPRIGGSWRWTHAHVRDVAYAIVLAAEQCEGGTFNIGESETPTIS